jgi:hypothetical protein
MKKWTVTIEAKDEAEALVYIEMMTSSFKAAIMMGQPMTHCYMDDPKAGTKLICTTFKKRWSWIRRG